MPKLAKQLTDPAARKAIIKPEPYTLASGNGLFLLVLPTGSKQWQVRYRTPEGQRSKKIIGIYPDVSIAQAHVLADGLHQAARMGLEVTGLYDDLKAKRKSTTDAEIEAQRQEQDRLQHCFTVISDRWLDDRRAGWQKATYDKNQFIVRKKLQPGIGNLDVRTMASKDVVDLLREIAAQTPSIAPKARQCINGVIEYCILRGLRGDDQVLRLKGVFPKLKGGHMPAITKYQEIGALMRAIDAYPGRVVRCALLLAAYTALRPGVVASAKWEEMDLEQGEWHIPGKEADGSNRMKTGNDHIVSLPTQALEALKEMQQFAGGPFVFPGVGNRNNPHIHRDALSKALRDMGFAGKHSTHGFRAMLRTVARERLKVDLDVLEAQLAHAKKDQIQSAYDRTDFAEERKSVMQAWADYLDELKVGAQVIQLKQA
ncbi:tyrosine-type recombinase/integrase [Methylobacillus methanolivorans]|uniref:Tyrosine-type recombinase/integrase n=1 Tax=Methylobacillus methanolivorans TaxID=1848927 RepID=A0ABW8GGX8_9PROT